MVPRTVIPFACSNVMYHWLLTSTTYGTWLPGDRRGFVSTITDAQGQRVRHNVPGTPYDADIPPLEANARQSLKCPPIRFRREQAELLVEQFQETAAYRSWQLLAAAVMANHIHAVVGADEAVSPETILRDLKSYGSRALNRRWGRPARGTWWTQSGSKRWLKDEAAVIAAVQYVRRQEFALVFWLSAAWRESGD